MGLSFRMTKPDAKFESDGEDEIGTLVTTVEVTEDDFIRLDWDEQIEERERILKEQEEGSLRNPDGSLNYRAIMRRWNRVGRRKRLGDGWRKR